ncbi:MAG: hypothetical protein IJ089_00650 [Clostridia bacterium]|nr:hypothetical protein [Clostridia bacterium]
MRIVKWILKIPALALMLATGLLRWIASFAVAMSHWIFYLAASALFCLGLICFAFQEATFQQIIPLLAVSFILYILPHIAIGIVGGLAGLNARLRLFVRS